MESHGKWGCTRAYVESHGKREKFDFFFFLSFFLLDFSSDFHFKFTPLDSLIIKLISFKTLSDQVYTIIARILSLGYTYQSLSFQC